MNCQKCHKPATFHITDLTGDELLALHLCADCAKEYLNPEEEPVDEDPPAEEEEPPEPTPTPTVDPLIDFLCRIFGCDP